MTSEERLLILKERAEQVHARYLRLRDAIFKIEKGIGCKVEADHYWYFPEKSLRKVICLKCGKEEK